jgi:hypothetical protein
MIDIFLLGHQALFATLKQISDDQNYSVHDRDKALDLFNTILNDSFLFYLHFHHDLQECVSGNLFALQIFIRIIVALFQVN